MTRDMQVLRARSHVVQVQVHVQQPTRSSSDSLGLDCAGAFAKPFVKIGRAHV